MSLGDYPISQSTSLMQDEDRIITLIIHQSTLIIISQESVRQKFTRIELIQLI